MIGRIAAPVEIELVDDARRNALVVLAEIKQKTVRRRREDMHGGIGVCLFLLPQHGRDEGKTYCFGNEAAKTEFMKDPQGNLAKAQSYYSSKHPG